MAVFRRMTSTLLTLATIALLAGCETKGPDLSADGGLLEAPDEWPSFGRTPGEQHYSPLQQINTETAGRLSLAWYYDLPSGNSMTAPVMAEGKLFVTTGHSFIRALDAATGKLLWEFDSQSRQHAGYRLRYGYGPKGLAYWNGRVFIVTHEGRVIALDAADGKPLWEAVTIPYGELPNANQAPAEASASTVGDGQLLWDQVAGAGNDGRYVNGAPRVFNGKLIIGHGGADVGPARGYVDCFDAMTGKKLWRFYTVPGNPADGFEQPAMEMAARTWSGEWWRHGGGGTVWNAISYDPELNYFYLGTGNGFPYNHMLRSEGKGDNLFLASIVAVDADNGRYVWHYQTTPAEQTDYNADMDMTLATLTIDGRERKVLMQAPKNGFFYVLDRTNGELISAKPFAKVSWASHIDLETGRPVESPGYRFHGKDLFELWPGMTGAHSWMPQSFSPRTGLVYIPVQERASTVGDKGLDLSSPNVGMGVIGEVNLDVHGARKSYLKAWDPIKQEPRWAVKTPGDWPGGTLATAGDLVFQGRVDGKFVAYNAVDGGELWNFDVGVPVLAPPISYAVNGTQYVTVLSGSGTSGGGVFAAGIADYRPDYRLPRRVLTFALDGKAQLPPNPPLPPLAPPDDPTYVPNAELEQQGALQYAMSGCLVCHGANAIAGGSAPDLRISALPANRDAFHAIVRDGALLSRGMPQFPEITEEQAEAIRQYLRERGRALGVSEDLR